MKAITIPPIRVDHMTAPAPLAEPRRLQRAPGAAQVVVGYPHNVEVMASFCSSLAELVRFEFRVPDPRYDFAALCTSGGSLIANNRRGLVQEMMRIEGDWLLQLDTDLSFPHTLLRDLFNAAEHTGSKIVSGLYWRLEVKDGKFNKSPVAYNVNEHGQFSSVVTPEDGPIEGAGGGALLVHREVFEKMAAERPNCEPYEKADPWWSTCYDGKKEPLGEDLSFFWRARTLGYKPYLLASALCKHWKTVPIG